MSEEDELQECEICGEYAKEIVMFYHACPLQGSNYEGCVDCESKFGGF